MADERAHVGPARYQRGGDAKPKVPRRTRQGDRADMLWRWCHEPS